MFGKWRNVVNLRKGIEMSLTMNLFGLPEVLVVHSKYEAETMAILMDVSKYQVRTVVVTLDPEAVCEDCAANTIRDLSKREYPDAESLVNVRYFGIPQNYVNAVSKRVNSSC